MTTTIVLVIMTALAGAQTTSAFAQAVAVSGQVIDARTGHALAGIDVRVEEPALTVRTDGEGRFTMSLAPGTRVFVVSTVGFAVLRQPITISSTGPNTLTLALTEGAGAFEERVTVAGTTATAPDAAPAATELHGRELQALRGVTMDDPLRALHAVPSVAATDDFYTEFAVRGLPFRQIGLSVDGIPTRFLMHSVHGITDGGSIAMINSDAIGALSLAPGSYPQRFGRHTGAQLDIALRDGSRDGVRGRVGLSGTSAGAIAEGPIGDRRGSWLVSARRSYLDWLLKRIDEDGTIAFGFTDTEAKLVFDVTPRHQIQALAVVGTSAFGEDPEDLGVNDEATIGGRSWLGALSWRFAPSASFLLTQRVYSTGLHYTNRNIVGSVLDDSHSHDAGWRADGSFAPRSGLVFEFGGDATLQRGRHERQRSLNDAAVVSTISSYSDRGHAASAYLQASITAGRISAAAGGRADIWQPSSDPAVSPWLTMRLSMTPKLQFKAGAGIYRQFPLLEQLHGLGGNETLIAETARHLDIGVSQALPFDSTVQVTWYARDEENGLRRMGFEPRRDSDGQVVLARGDAPWANVLSGTARGVEALWRRDAPSGLTGWVGYAYGRHTQTDMNSGESFSSDFDQRHAVTVFGQYRISNRTSIGAKFRYGSNYPITGYIAEAPRPANAPQLLGGGQPLFLGLADTRNGLRLPVYARLDLRVDRTMTIAGRRMTLFVEVANTLNRRNLRNVPYGVDRLGRVQGATDSLLPIIPSAGFVIDF